MGAGDVFEFRRLQNHFRRLQDALRREQESHCEDIEMYEEELARLCRVLSESHDGPSGSSGHRD